MEFLDNFVLPQSAHHMVLIKYLLVLTYLLLIPYLSVLMGSLIYSLYYKSKSEGNSSAYRLSKELIDLTTFHKGLAFSFGLVPLISASFGYAQLLHKTGVNVPEYLLIAALIFFFAILLVYTFKYSFHLKDIFKSAEEKKIGEDERTQQEISSYSFNAVAINKKSGKYALLLLMLCLYIFIGSLELASNSAIWASGTSILNVFFSLSALLGFLKFVAASLAFTPVIVMYKYFRNEGQFHLQDSSYTEFIKGFVLPKALVFTLIYLVLTVLYSVSKPSTALSYNSFGYLVAGLLILLFVTSLLYQMLKQNNAGHSLSVMFLFVIVFGIFIVKDQYSFDVATKQQFALLENNYIAFETKLMEEMGVASVSISGADIYNGRCIACHNFDKKLVGPPYNTTMPKYEGKKDQLVKYILNPVKVNPEYPPMPNQGLKPKEAEAVAEYLLTTYKK